MDKYGSVLMFAKYGKVLWSHLTIESLCIITKYILHMVVEACY